MEIKLEIGENLRGAIEEISYNTVRPGSQIHKAFGIDFMQLIKEHAESGDVRLEVEDTFKLTDYTELKYALAPLIGVEDISNGEINTLITIAKGIYWRADLHEKIIKLEREINREINK